MAKRARWICLEYHCARICVSHAPSADEFCLCGKYRQSGIKLPVPAIRLEPGPDDLPFSNFYGPPVRPFRKK